MEGQLIRARTMEGRYSVRRRTTYAVYAFAWLVALALAIGAEWKVWW